jgi:glycosyltransferase involved in cell wall biosynthesis
VKFSVVIPCHDRLELLRKAVHTILEQIYEDWELAVFDNSSKDDIQSYIRNLDPKFQKKIKYQRSDEFLPVTDSWNHAINMASGDYIIFLGDDDGLIPNFFHKIRSVILDFDHPDVMYSALYQFLYPGVAPWDPSGYVSEIKNAFFFRQNETPFLLSDQDRLEAVKGSLTLCRNFTFNIQAFTFSKKFLDQLKKDGPIFRSSFPDYYLANVAIAKADRIVVVPQPMAIAGVSKASVGYALFNGLEEKFASILNSKIATDKFYPEIQQKLLPGPGYNTSYIMTMKHIAEYLTNFISCRVNIKKYRKMQIYHFLHLQNAQGKNSFYIACWKLLSPFEKIWAFKVFLFMKLSKISGSIEKYFRNSVLPETQMVSFHPFQKKSSKQYQCLTEIYEAISKNEL